MAKRLTEERIEKMAVEIRAFLLEHGIWQDTDICIIVNIHAFVNIEKDICIKRLEFFNIMALLITVLADE